MQIYFAFIGEGSSDRGLVQLIEQLLVRSGVNEAIGTAPELERLPFPPGKSIEAQLRAIVELEPALDLVFIHRDADSPSASARRAEVIEATSQSPLVCVPVVPVQELEAWLILDEAAIRRVASDPGGTVALSLPRPKAVERIADPKRRLKNALSVASGLSGRRLEKFNMRFPLHRQLLLQELDLDGPVSEVPSWRQLVEDIVEVVRKMEMSLVG